MTVSGPAVPGSGRLRRLLKPRPSRRFPRSRVAAKLLMGWAPPGLAHERGGHHLTTTRPGRPRELRVEEEVEEAEASAEPSGPGTTPRWGIQQEDSRNAWVPEGPVSRGSPLRPLNP